MQILFIGFEFSVLYQNTRSPEFQVKITIIQDLHQLRISRYKYERRLIQDTTHFWLSEFNETSQCVNLILFSKLCQGWGRYHKYCKKFQILVCTTIPKNMIHCKHIILQPHNFSRSHTCVQGGPCVPTLSKISMLLKICSPTFKVNILMQPQS